MVLPARRTAVFDSAYGLRDADEQSASPIPRFLDRADAAEACSSFSCACS